MQPEPPKKRRLRLLAPTKKKIVYGSGAALKVAAPGGSGSTTLPGAATFEGAPQLVREPIFLLVGTRGWEFAHSLICSKSLILLSDCEQFPQITQEN